MRNLLKKIIFGFIALISSAASQDSPSAPAASMPPAEEGAMQVLNSSPRHGEWVDIAVAGDSIPLRSWIVYPERSDKAPVVIVIHEIFGLSDWIRSVADRLAEAGYIAVAPDFISGLGPNGGGTASMPNRDAVVGAIRNLSAEETYRRANAAYAYAMSIPSANGQCASIGFCWGGGRSFGYACVQPKLSAAVVYYGTSPTTQELASLNVPVLGLYGGDDARVGATVEPAAVEIKRLGKSFDYEMFKGAGHGFLRQQNDRNGANLLASQQAWKRTLDFLSAHFKN